VSLASLAIAAGGLALLVVSVRQAGWDTIVASFRSLGPWLLAVVLLGAARMAFRARAWTLCSRAHHDIGIPFRAAFVAILAGDALGNLTPLGLLASEPAKVVMGRRHVSTAASLSSVTVENGFYTASVAAMLLSGVWVMLQRANVPPCSNGWARASWSHHLPGLPWGSGCSGRGRQFCRAWVPCLAGSAAGRHQPTRSSHSSAASTT
jgi:hypothetical protein